MQAMLEVTGLMAGEHFDLSCFMSNFRTHIETGRLLKHDNGKYSLSDLGRAYFISRLTDAPVAKGQLVSRSEVIEMLRLITSEVAESGWISIN